MTDDFIERRIVTGFIISTEFIQEVSRMFKMDFLTSSTARLLSQWCLEHFQQYSKAPGRDIESIYMRKLRDGMPKNRAEDIEEILSGLSRDYERQQFNVPLLVDEAKRYFQERNLLLYAESVSNAVSVGDLTGAENAALNYKSAYISESKTINPFENRRKIRDAFRESEAPLIRFSKALGEYWDDQFVREGFIALMGPEKRGKTFMLMEIALRGMKAGCCVVFFQAGDMSENQQLKRLCVYLAKRSNKAKYCGEMYVPIVDCRYNQTGECDREERECDFSVFAEIPKSLKYEELCALVKENPDYRPCSNCRQYMNHGAVWLKKKEKTEPLNWKEAWQAMVRWRKRHRKEFKLCTYANETLTVSEIKSLLDIWERQESFIPDLIVVDYADILAPDRDVSHYDFRNQTNKLWQRLRSLSQERRCLIVTATQSDAKSYDQETLRKFNFSEDKRKFAHVTAMYGLNQTEEEKKIGILRINELVIREGEFYESNQIKVLQRLQMGRPYLGAFK
jgi:hypothetical protein